MRNCDIKFVNKEITPFGGLSLFFKSLKNAILKSILCKVAFHFKDLTVATNQSN